MSTTTTDLKQLDDKLNRLILEGKALEGLERFYADDVVMQENTAAPTVGKTANRAREIDFFDSVAEVHEVSLLGNAAGQDVTFSEWIFDVTLKNGTRSRLDQTSVRRWKDGRIVHERFYYQAA